MNSSKVREARQALEALADKMAERCGDHCQNSCKICEYRNDLRLILARTAALASEPQPAGKPCAEGGEFDARGQLEDLASYMGERCGDHCSNSCRMCDARTRLRMILISMGPGPAVKSGQPWPSGGIESFSEGDEPPMMIGTEAMGNGNEHFGIHEQTPYCKQRGCKLAGKSGEERT